MHNRWWSKIYSNIWFIKSIFVSWPGDRHVMSTCRSTQHGVSDLLINCISTKAYSLQVNSVDPNFPSQIVNHVAKLSHLNPDLTLTLGLDLTWCNNHIITTILANPLFPTHTSPGEINHSNYPYILQIQLVEHSKSHSLLLYLQEIVCELRGSIG